MKKKHILLIAILMLCLTVSFMWRSQQCYTNQIEVMNALHNDIEISISGADELLAEEYLPSNKPKTLYLRVPDGDISYTVSVKDMKTGQAWSDTFGYTYPHDSDKYFFLINEQGIHDNSWSMFGSSVLGTILHVLYITKLELKCAFH